MNRSHDETRSTTIWEILAPVALIVIVSVAAILLRSLLGMLSLVVMLIFVIASTMGARRLDRHCCSTPPTPAFRLSS